MFKNDGGMRIGALMLMTLVVSGCDQLGLETPAKMAEKSAAEAKAVGSACRHAMRAIEDCYLLNPKADKAAVFAGWREMDEYMRENKLEGIAPQVQRPAAAASKAQEDDEEGSDEAEPSTAREGDDTADAGAKGASGAKAVRAGREAGRTSAQDAAKGSSKAR